MQRLSAIFASVLLSVGAPAIAQDEAIEVEGPPPQLSGLKAAAAQSVGDKQKLTQEIVDSLFSFSELGFQEFETQRYLTEILEDNGFTMSSRSVPTSMASRSRHRRRASPIASQLSKALRDMAKAITPGRR
jgi:hypothetical protein